MIGTKLAHFEITAKLGEGGMGEVYRAEDTKLGREVAIKVLPEELARDPERLARFEREAKLLASLNHPHIAGIYQVEQDGETHFLVMELVEGLDLAERLAQGPMELDEAISMAHQIAQAFEAAHERGIVHRDLKPANVKVTPAGQVKVLDFGLAKALDAAETSSTEQSPTNLSVSPTLTAQMTEAGIILGTAAYMSPEQARGKPVDRRADVWAFGVLLWEILTARRLFGGETVTDVIASVVTKEPDPDLLPAATPAELERLLVRCLRKDPSQRLPDIGSARLVLQDLMTGKTPEVRAPETGADEAGAAEDSWLPRPLWLASAAALVAFGIVAAALLTRPTGPAQRPQPVRFSATAPEGWSIDTNDHSPVPSPAGDRVVFRASRENPEGDTESMLFVRALSSPAALPLGGTDDVNRGGPIVWSPDGDSLLFGSGDALRVLDLHTGSVRDLGRDLGQRVTHATWNDSDTILYSSNGTLHILSAVGGSPRPLTSLNPSRAEFGHFFPQFLPDGNRFLFSVWSEDPDLRGLYVASLDEPDRRQAVVVGSEWVRREYADGHLLWVNQRTLFAQPFDAEQAQLEGEPVAIASPVHSSNEFVGLGAFATGASTTVAFWPGTAEPGNQLAWRDRKGKLIELVGPPDDYRQIALSPDGRLAAVEILDEQGQFDIWTMDLSRGVASRLTTSPESERDPVWSPDSRSIAYVRFDEEVAALCLKGLGPSDSEVVLLESEEIHGPESWSPDGAHIMLLHRTQENEVSVRKLLLEEGAAPMVSDSMVSGGVVHGENSPVDEPQISPDGRWLAYLSEESGRPEIYLEPLGREGERIRVSLQGGGQPKWRADGRELFFANPRGRLMAVEIATEIGQQAVGLPQPLFEIDHIQGPGYDDYAVSADGQRFLVKTTTGQVTKLID